MSGCDKKVTESTFIAVTLTIPKLKGLWLATLSDSGGLKVLPKYKKIPYQICADKEKKIAHFELFTIHNSNPEKFENIRWLSLY